MHDKEKNKMFKYKKGKKNVQRVRYELSYKISKSESPLSKLLLLGDICPDFTIRHQMLQDKEKGKS